MIKVTAFIRAHWFLFFLTASAFLLRLSLIPYRNVCEADGCHYISFAKDFLNGSFGTIGTYWAPGWVSLISVFTIVMKDPEIAGRFLNAVAGALLVPVIFTLTLRLFNRKAALFAALLVAVTPGLMLFSTLLFTEAVYALLLPLLLLALYVAIRRGELRWFYLSGCALGITYSFRSEALLFAIVVIGLIFLRVKRKALCVLLFALGAATTVAPVVIFYHAQYNQWTLGAKSTNLIYGELGDTSRKVSSLMTENFAEPEYVAQMRRVLQLSPLTFLSIKEFFIPELSLNSRRLVEDLPALVFPFAYSGALFWPLFFAGITGAIREQCWKKLLFLLSFPALALFVVSLCFLEPRKIVPFVPLFLCIVALGIASIERLLHSRLQKTAFYSLIIAGFVACAWISYNKVKPGIESEHMLLMKETGQWMRAHLSQDATMFAPDPAVPYYFYERTPNNFCGVIYADYPLFLRYVRSRNVRYITVFNFLNYVFQFSEYLFTHGTPEELTLLATLKRGNLEARVYALKDTHENLPPGK